MWILQKRLNVMYSASDSAQWFSLSSGKGTITWHPLCCSRAKVMSQTRRRHNIPKMSEYFFTPEAFNKGPTMDRYLAYWWSKVNDGNPKIFIMDSSSTHLDKETIRSMRQKRVVFAIIPGVSSLIMFLWTMLHFLPQNCSSSRSSF